MVLTYSIEIPMNDAPHHMLSLVILGSVLYVTRLIVLSDQIYGE